MSWVVLDRELRLMIFPLIASCLQLMSSFHRSLRWLDGRRLLVFAPFLGTSPESSSYVVPYNSLSLMIASLYISGWYLWLATLALDVIVLNNPRAAHGHAATRRFLWSRARRCHYACPVADTCACPMIFYYNDRLTNTDREAPPAVAVDCRPWRQMDYSISFGDCCPFRGCATRALMRLLLSVVCVISCSSVRAPLSTVWSVVWCWLSCRQASRVWTQFVDDLLPVSVYPFCVDAR